MANFWFSLAGWSLMLFWSTVSPAFLSVPGAATKFINANFAADLAANDLI